MQRRIIAEIDVRPEPCWGARKSSQFFLHRFASIHETPPTSGDQFRPRRLRNPKFICVKSLRQNAYIRAADGSQSIPRDKSPAEKPAGPLAYSVQHSAR